MTQSQGLIVQHFEIIYKKGKQNVVADALSRKEEDTKGLLCAISILYSDWMEEAMIEWKQDHSKTTRGTKCIRYIFVEE
jgi:hypothetical protein